jgi:hypothetical protein
MIFPLFFAWLKQKLQDLEIWFGDIVSLIRDNFSEITWFIGYIFTILYLSHRGLGLIYPLVGYPVVTFLIYFFFWDFSKWRDELSEDEIKRIREEGEKENDRKK